METLKKYIDKIKEWQFKHPAKFVFILGVFVGFILRSLF
jgi:hypothetical protein